MKSMTKTNLTFESFTQAVIDQLNKSVNESIVEEIVSSFDESDSLNDLYEEGCTVGYAATAIIDEHNEYHGLNRRSMR